jgi:hypothetical protein
MRWASFVESAGDLGSLAEEQVARARLGLLGTLRADGWPRISPCELFVVDGDLSLGMMWRSRKALDLARDPRIVVHSVPPAASGTAPDVKLYGTAIDVPDPATRSRYGDTLDATIDWRPSEPFHLFALDVREAAAMSFGAQHRAMRWSDSDGLVILRHPDDREPNGDDPAGSSPGRSDPHA